MAIHVFDFFSGCGGTSKGFELAGLKPVFALDNDKDAIETFKLNFPKVKCMLKDIRELDVEDIHPFFEKSSKEATLFCGCAPCQPFTKQNTKKTNKDNRIPLLMEFGRFVESYKPTYIFVENVPGLQKVNPKKGPLAKFIALLDRLEYKNQYTCKVISSQNYGVPQRRRRFILIASRIGTIDFPTPTHGPNLRNQCYSTVRQWIGDLCPLSAGERDPQDIVHRAANLSQLNLMRIQALTEGGSRTEWPVELCLDCHSNKYSGHTDVYGRMYWDKPSSGLTTRCISLSNGRFGHPEQDRAISAREAACLQTFPRDFIFHGNLNSMARQIGNAVPVLLAQRFGENFIQHYQTYGGVL